VRSVQIQRKSSCKETHLEPSRRLAQIVVGTLGGRSLTFVALNWPAQARWRANGSYTAFGSHLTRRPREVQATWPVELPPRPGSRTRRCPPDS